MLIFSCKLIKTSPHYYLESSLGEKEHSKELLNHTASPNSAFSPPDITAAENYPCEVDPPTLDEVCTAIRQLRHNRAPGEDGIPAEVQDVPRVPGPRAASGDYQSLVM